MAYDVIVVGAGITGASTAYHLVTLGAGKVMLIERGAPASGGTGQSAAIVRQHYSAPITIRLVKASVEKFAAMPEELGATGVFERSGWYFLLNEKMVAGARANAAMQREIGIETRFLDAAEREARMPWLNAEGVAAVIHEPASGFADPVRATEAYVAAFAREGGEVRTSTPVRALLREGERVTGVLTDEGALTAGAVVNAAGPWARTLAASAGIELSLRTVREQDTVWEARGGRPLPEAPISNGVDATYIRPLGERRYIFGRGFPKDYEDVDPNNYKLTADQDFIAEVQTRVQHRIPPFQGARLIDSYAALYDVTPDWYPFIGPRRALTGYYDACGGSGHGFKLGPAIGEELARWIVTGEAAEDFAQLSYDRLADGTPFVQAFGGNRG